MTRTLALVEFNQHHMFTLLGSLIYLERSFHKWENNKTHALSVCVCVCVCVCACVCVCVCVSVYRINEGGYLKINQYQIYI
jgi:hypothetical protein